MKPTPFSNTVELVKKLNEAIEKIPDLGQYWIDANDQLTKGYTLPVNLQNLLDDINASLADQFKNGLVDIQSLSLEKINELVKSVELQYLGLFLIRNGVSHHYHCTSGTTHPWRLEIDLKVMPTIHNKLGEPKAAICFMSVTVVTGDIYNTPVGQIPADGRVYQGSKLIYVGPESVKVRHAPVLTAGNANRPLTNEMLGAWLYTMRNISYEDHVILIDHDRQML